MGTSELIADDLGVDVADVRWVVSEYLGIDLHEDEFPPYLINEVRDTLDPMCLRSVPEGEVVSDRKWWH